MCLHNLNSAPVIAPLLSSSILGLAEMELIFSLASCVRLQPWFVTKPVLVTCHYLATAQWCLHRAEAFSITVCPSGSCLDWARVWEGTQLGQLTLTAGGDIPCCMTLCSAIKQGESPSKITITWKVAEHQSAGVRWWVIAFTSHGSTSFFFIY